MLDPFAAFALMLFLCTAALVLVSHMSRRERQSRAVERLHGQLRS